LLEFKDITVRITSVSRLSDAKVLRGTMEANTGLKHFLVGGIDILDVETDVGDAIVVDGPVVLTFGSRHGCLELKELHVSARV